MKRFLAVLPASLLLTVMNTAAPEQQTARTGPAVRYADLTAQTPAALPAHSIVLTVETGDTLDSVLVDGGLEKADAAALTHEIARSFDLRRLRPGNYARFHYEPGGRVDSVEVKIAGWGEMDAVRTGQAFVVTPQPAAVREVDATVSAKIESSLYDALISAGEGPQLAQSIVDIFQWDVDFFALQRGDSFSLVVKKRYSGPDPAGYGPVLAARFTHNGQTYEAFRQQMPDGRSGYYAPNGAPLRKQFLRAPLKFTRITSKFSKSRWHPILHCFRPHNGVDYGAPVGTPVMTTADGVVIEAGRKGGDGNYIRVRHTSRIDTYYLHLSRFAKGIRRGAKVVQGEVIGYVGATGLATGPHLDYRVSDHGTWLDPLKLKSITPDPLPRALAQQFRINVASLSPKLAVAAPQVAEFAPRRRALF
ncbi:MAG TPA: peptidoglycan DD-metalloendopeptidase family protein [Thermoanaerobaculia bacterium]|nr:peptidoglycan DD-metalloendopeptidase family protein [Thermoanaerobaculia bacterium]